MPANKSDADKTAEKSQINPQTTEEQSNSDNQADNQPSGPTIKEMEDHKDKSCWAKKTTSWLLTLNNPAKWFRMPDATPEELLQHAMDLWTKTKRGKERVNRGCAGCFEIGLEEHTPHIHLVLVSVSRVAFEVVRNTYSAPDPELQPGQEGYGEPVFWGWLLPTKGSVEQQRGYLNKTGKYATKEETTVVAMRYQGDTPLIDGKIANPNKKTVGGGGWKNDPYSRSNTLREIDELLAEGKTPDEITSLSVKYKVLKDAINAAYYDPLKAEIPALRDLTVVYHCGDSGTGKSHCRLIYEEEDPSQIYVPPPDGHIWDGYNYQQILFLDEFRASQIRWDMFLRVLDRYRLTLPARYNNKEAAWTRVEITTTVPIEALYINKTSSVFPIERRAIMSEDELLEAKRERHDNFSQLMRRIDWVMYHYVDPLYAGDEQYRVVQIPGRAYKCIEQAERLARERLTKHEEIVRGGMFVNQHSLDELIEEQQKELLAEAELASVPGISRQYDDERTTH